MSHTIMRVGRVCLCEWTGAVTVTTVVALLSQVKHVQERERDPLLLILSLDEAATRSVAYGSSSFLGALPALWSHCQGIVVACPAQRSLRHQLRQGLCGPASSPLALASTPLCFYESLDGALRHALEISPHDVLEVQRLRLRRGTWPVCETGIGGPVLGFRGR